MADQKFIHDVSPEKTRDAQFTSIADIPSAMLTNGSTVRLFPGTYGPVSGVNGTNLHFVGVGDREEIIVGGFTFNNTSAGTLSFENMTINGPNKVQSAISSCIEVLGVAADAKANVRIRNCILANSNVGVKSHAGGTVIVEYSDLSDVDKALRANGAMTLKYSHVSTVQVANTYADSLDSTIRAVTLVGMYVTGNAVANGATTTKTVVTVAS